MSARWKIDWNDVRSTLRHTVVPLVAGAAMAALQVASGGTFDVPLMVAAAKTAAVAGAIRWLSLWASTTVAPGEPSK
jgi:uncharacterized membrane protein